MKNFPIKLEDGTEWWISRSVSSVILITGIDKDDEEYILAVTRGDNTPDPEFKGKWCLPCGYLDYNETIEECALRELFEETGLKIPLAELILIHIEDRPDKDKKQNIIFFYTNVKNYPIEKSVLSSKYSSNEVETVKWIKLSEIEELEWAFNQKEFLVNFYNLIKE